MKIGWMLSWVWLMACGTMAFAADDVAQALFTRVFGDAVKLDPAMVEQVVKGEPGKRHYVDRNQDGRPEEVWFIDTARRHLEKFQPVLVKVVDEDGDLNMGDEPDLDSDLYIADWKADGVMNVICDYTDRDGDQDVDEMGLYFTRDDELVVWWGDDVGDDNLLWYDVGYTYQQTECQYRTHFGGKEIFNAYQLHEGDADWTPLWENPFVFYDHDEDGVTEEVVRIEGLREVVKNVRYSFDADNDARPDSPRDFDVSISAHALPGLVIPPALSESRMLRDIPTGLFLSYASVPEFSHQQTWGKTNFCWDENDLNMDGADLRDGVFTDTQERWEGVICKGSDYFPQIGGPNCGFLNKRYEVDDAPAGPFTVYYAPVDQRIHLTGADHAWMEVDYTYDGKADMRYEYSDENGDGMLDVWRIDVNADGQFDDSWQGNPADYTPMAYTYADLNARMKEVLPRVNEALVKLVARLREASKKNGLKEADPVWKLIASGFDVPGLVNDTRLRTLSSDEAYRYYLDVLKDRQIAALKAAYAQPAFWASFDALRARGDMESMRQSLEETFSLNDPLRDYAALKNENLAKLDAPCTAWAQDWVPPNIGWESDVCAYRVYWGQFDFFGKSKPGLIYPGFGKGENYHNEQAWGMDALHVDRSCGIGGVMLYVNGTAYPVWSPQGEGPIQWSKRLVRQDTHQVVIETVADHVGPADAPFQVRFTCAAQKGKRDSAISVAVSGGPANAAVELGVGLIKLKQEQYALDRDAGVMASWGIQDPQIGYIGLGIAFPKEAFVREEDRPDQHQVVLRVPEGAPVQYHIEACWLNGQRFARCPGFSNWQSELRATAANVWSVE